MVTYDSMVLLRTVAVAQRGLYYRFRYRAINSVGWGAYSNFIEVLAAQPPIRPARPDFISSTGTAITLKFYETQDDGGARVSSYELWMSANYEAASPTFTKVSGYTNNAM